MEYLRVALKHDQVATELLIVDVHFAIGVSKNVFFNCIFMSLLIGLWDIDNKYVFPIMRFQLATVFNKTLYFFVAFVLINTNVKLVILEYSSR